MANGTEDLAVQLAKLLQYRVQQLEQKVKP